MLRPFSLREEGDVRKDKECVVTLREVRASRIVGDLMRKKLGRQDGIQLGPDDARFLKQLGIRLGQQWLEKGLVYLGVRFEEEVRTRVEQLVDLPAPESDAWVQVHDVASGMSLERGLDVVYDIICQEKRSAHN